MSELVYKFIHHIDKSCTSIDTGTMRRLVLNSNGNGRALVNFVKEHPDVLTQKIYNHLVFDYFYEKVITDTHHPTISSQWHENLCTIIELLDHIDSTIIKSGKKYILRLQSTNRTLCKLFRTLLSHGFDMGDSEFLVYSIIARGELSKLKILAEQYMIEDYPGVLDVALHYGRAHIINYFISTMDLDIRTYGKIVNFENYKDNCRYLYYQEHISQEHTFRHRPAISHSKQNYTQALSLILDKYEYEIDLRTIDIWCEFIRGKVYLWDSINAQETLSLLRDRVRSSIPLTHDFREFNTIIFGREWSDRKCLIEYCLNIEEKLSKLQQRYELVQSQLQHMREKCDQMTNFMAARVRAQTRERGRRETS